MIIFHDSIEIGSRFIHEVTKNEEISLASTIVSSVGTTNIKYRSI